MRHIAACCFVFLCSVAEAGSVQGTISNLYQRASDGLILVYINGNISGRPNCAMGTAYWIVRDENSNTGKGHFATLLAAKLAGKAVAITGSNSCARWSDGEDINFIQIID